MNGTIKVIHLEDIRSDADIVRREMGKGDFKLDWLWAKNRIEFEAGLSSFAPDIILSDHSLPEFSSFEAFQLLKASGIDIPFILITSTISEEFAVMMMKEGIADYLLKDRLQRLPVAAVSALDKWNSEKQRRNHLNEILRSEARFRALIENNFDAIVLRDENMTMIYESSSVGRILGAPMGELAGRDTIAAITHPDDLALLQTLSQNVMANQGVSFPCALRLRHRQGHYVWMEGVQTNMLHDENVKGIVTNFRDVTERKQAEIQREQITADLMDRNKNLEQFAYIVSHNLRAPVAKILGISHLLEFSELKPKDREKASVHLYESTKKLDDVIHDLNIILQWREEIHDKKESIIFQDLVDDIKLTIAGVMHKVNATISTDFTNVDRMSTIKSFLYSIFYNLMVNGIKYRREGVDPVISISSATDGDHIILKFTDNGIGIDLAAHGDNVFGLYRRFHPKIAEGKGMGLFMTKTQVETLGGKISIESKVDQGTTFRIEL